MTESPATQGSPPLPPTAWQRLQHHKVLQWSLAYAAAAYTVLHATQMLAESFEWPHLIVRVVALILVLGVPIVVLLAWYHGHKAQHRFSTAELSMLTVLLLIAGTLLWAFTRSSTPGSARREGVSHSTAAANPQGRSVGLQVTGAPRASVAVVPFANLTGEADKEYFSDGMAEEMINSLAHVPGLKVPARTSSFAYKGRNTDIRRIAADLGVATILEGSVRSAGTRIRVSAQLVDAMTGYHIWSESYDRQFTDVFKIQDEIAAAIVQALSGYFNTQVAAPATASAPTQDVLAYQLYLQAQATERGTEESFRHALQLLDRALERDPRFVRALARRAGIRLAMRGFGYPLPHALEDAERDAAAALAIDPNSAAANDVAGTISAWRGQWLDAERAFHLSIAAEPNDPTHHVNYARLVLEPAGHFRKSAQELREAYRLAPASPYVVVNYAGMDSFLGQHNEALRLATLATELGTPPTVIPLPMIRVNAAVSAGQCAQATRDFAQTLTKQVLAAGGIDAQQLACQATSDPTRRPAARTAVLMLFSKLDVASLTSSDTLVMLELLTRVGALDQAYQLANQSFNLQARTGGIGSWNSLWTPQMRPFRTDPRFQAFVTRLKLHDYWKQYGPPDECELQGATLVCH